LKFLKIFKFKKNIYNFFVINVFIKIPSINKNTAKVVSCYSWDLVVVNSISA